MLSRKTAYVAAGIANVICSGPDPLGVFLELNSELGAFMQIG